VAERREWIAVVVGCALAALVLDFSTLHAWQTADSLMSVLISLVRWTPYYWGQDRFGMLLPALAMPVREPVANLLVQTFFQGFTTLLGPFVLAWLSGFRAWVVGGVLGALTLVVALPEAALPPIVFNPVGLSIVLAGAGFAVMQRFWPAGLLLTVAALWVNVGVLLLVPPLLLLTRGRSAVKRHAIVWVIAALVARAMMRVWGVMSTRLNPAWPDAWPHAWGELARNAFADWGVAFVAAVLAGTLLLLRKQSERRRLAGVAGTALIFFLVVGTSRHVAASGFNSRFLSAIAMLVPAALWAAGGVQPAKTALAVAPALLAAVLLKFSMASPRALIEQKFLAAEVSARALGCTHVIGDYWTVWPVEFMSLEQGGPIIWAVSLRAEPTAAQWRSSAPAHWCARVGDSAVASLRDRYDLAGVELSPLP
jgi:hypothetical protein